MPSIDTKTPEPGRQLGHYLIVDRLGRGGMGEVLLARDTRLDRHVAMKFLPPEFVRDADRLQRFQREARLLAALNHPHIVTIYSVEDSEGYHFLTMEYVEGRTLRAMIPESGLALEKFFDLAEPLAEALGAAHERAITHRDLKPENVMVTESGRVKVLDFGLAKELRHDEGGGAASPDEATRPITHYGVIMGTAPYMSPEQAKGKAVDRRSDIFSLGIILYEMITGQRPFQGDTPADVITAILRDNPDSVTSLRPGLPNHLGRIIRQCIEKDPKDRFQSAVDLHHQLKDLRKELDSEPGMGAIQSSGRRVNRVISSASRRRARRVAPIRALLASRLGLAGLLALVFLANLVETTVETSVRAGAVAGEWSFAFADAAHGLEGELSFEAHDSASPLAVYGYSIFYFFLFPLMALITAITLSRRESIAPFRVFSLSIVLVYAISLPFFLFFPVPERWAYPESDAILLSDLWSSRLIEAIRPISGLDNCFPSFHVSLAVIIVLCCHLYRVQFRTVAVPLALTIILSTFALGIHWVVDIVAGLACGLIGVLLARKLDRRLDAWMPQTSDKLARN